MNYVFEYQINCADALAKRYQNYRGSRLSITTSKDTIKAWDKCEHQDDEWHVEIWNVTSLAEGDKIDNQRLLVAEVRMPITHNPYITLVNGQKVYDFKKDLYEIESARFENLIHDAILKYESCE